MQQIVHELDVSASKDKVREALTTQKGLAGWWTPDVKAQPKVGAVNEFGFGAGKPVFKLRVKALDADRIVWESVQGPPDWAATTVSFDLSGDGNKTRIRFAHAGFQSTDGGFGTYSYSWAQFLRSLKQLVETGRGEPAGM
jgi:uncharacterized protein YndB with AHSA1/START domain